MNLNPLAIFWETLLSESVYVFLLVFLVFGMARMGDQRQAEVPQS